MDIRSRSPSRRHILSSINPQDDTQTHQKYHESHKRRRDHSPKSTHNEEKPRDIEGDDATRYSQEKTGDTNHRSKKLRLKDHKSRRRGRSCSPHRHRRRHRSRTPPNPYAPPPLSSDKAFLESLFDAMADDEGAEYWQSVYGEPVHTLGGGQAALDMMGEEEYAAHVRARMWERTEEGREDARRRAREQAVREERELREERRQRRRQRERERAAAEEDVAQEVAASLARGQIRGQRRKGIKAWEEYTDKWKRWDGTIGEITWPVAGMGEWGVRDVTEQRIRAFITTGLKGYSEDEDEEGRAMLVARLREERVRWHPDKMQQRLGGSVEEGVMRDVTAVFQVVDKMWGEARV